MYQDWIFVMWLCGLAALVWNFGSIVVLVVFDKMPKKEKGLQKKEEEESFRGFAWKFSKICSLPPKFLHNSTVAQYLKKLN